jgi:hypothetical protein
MPFMDGTGPLGEGPGSGRGKGRCAAGTRGAGRGIGLGRRLGRCAARDPKTALEQEASFLERQLDRIKRQIQGPGGGKAV